jgi:hypothetical protein
MYAKRKYERKKESSLNVTECVGQKKRVMVSENDKYRISRQK